MDSICGVEASRIMIEVMLDGISPSGFGATSESFTAINVWVEVMNSLLMDGGIMTCGGDIRTSIGGVVVIL